MAGHPVTTYTKAGLPVSTHLALSTSHVSGQLGHDAESLSELSFASSELAIDLSHALWGGG